MDVNFHKDCFCPFGATRVYIYKDLFQKMSCHKDRFSVSHMNAYKCLFQQVYIYLVIITMSINCLKLFLWQLHEHLSRFIPANVNIKGISGVSNNNNDVINNSGCSVRLIWPETKCYHQLNWLGSHCMLRYNHYVTLTWNSWKCQNLDNKDKVFWKISRVKWQKKTFLETVCWNKPL